MQAEFLDAPCSYSLFTQCSFDSNKSKYSYYREVIEEVLQDLRKNLTEIIKHDKNNTTIKRREKIISQTRNLPCMQKKIIQNYNDGIL